MSTGMKATSPARIVWTSATGFECRIRSYDETRYQVRLARQGGTVKSDLYDNHQQAHAAALAWKTEIEEH